MMIVTDQLLQLDKQLCFKLYSASRKMTKAYAPFLDTFHLTYPQYIIMLAMFEHNVIDFKELSDIVDLKTGTLTPILQKLEKFGYIHRVQNEADKRKVNILLTDSGKKMNTEIISVPLGLSSKLKVTLETYETLMEELDELSNKLDKTIKE